MKINKFGMPLLYATFLTMTMSVCGEDSQPLGYCASGELKLQQVVSNGVVRFEQVWQFTLTEDMSGEWKLEICTVFPDKNLPVSVTNVISCDLTNIYSVNYSSDIVATPIIGKPKLVEMNKQASSAVISSGCYPIDDSSAVGVIWLAFLGGNYLDQDKAQARFPNLLVPDPRRDPRAWDCDLKYSVIRSANSQIINSCKYIIQKAYIRSSAVDYPEMDEPTTDKQRESSQQVFARYQKLKSASTVTSDYYLDETTNLNGRLIPMRFHSNLGLENASGISDRFMCVVTNVIVAVTTNLMPSLKGAVYVEDRRMRYKDQFKFRKNVYYKLSQDVWPSDTNDSLVKSAVFRTPQQGIMERSSRPEKFLAVKILFVITILLPLPFFIVKRLRSKKKL